jgi:hypothetical protein
MKSFIKELECRNCKEKQDKRINALERALKMAGHKECAVYLLDRETGWLRAVLYGDMCSAAKEASDKNIPYESIEVYCVFPLVTLKDKGAGK